MESRKFTCPACDHPLTIKVLGSDLKGLFTLQCHGCKSQLTVDLSKGEPRLTEPPQPKSSRSAYNRLPPELAEREKRLKQAFQEAWGEPPPGPYLYDDTAPSPGTEGDGGPREGREPPRKPSGQSPPPGPGWGEPALDREGRPLVVAPPSRFPFQPFGRPVRGPPSPRLLLAAMLLAVAGIMGFSTLYTLANLDRVAAQEDPVDITVVLLDSEGKPLNLTAGDDGVNLTLVTIKVNDEPYPLSPNNQSRYRLENITLGWAHLTVVVPDYQGQKREVFITEGQGYLFLPGTDKRYVGNTFEFELEKGTGLAQTQSNPLSALMTVCIPLLFLFSVMALVGAYLTYQRTSYTGALLGGLGGLLAIGMGLFGPLAALAAIYLIHTNRREFTNPTLPPPLLGWQDRGPGWGPGEPPAPPPSKARERDSISPSAPSSTEDRDLELADEGDPTEDYPGEETAAEGDLDSDPEKGH